MFWGLCHNPSHGGRLIYNVRESRSHQSHPWQGPQQQNFSLSSGLSVRFYLLTYICNILLYKCFLHPDHLHALYLPLKCKILKAKSKVYKLCISFYRASADSFTLQSSRMSQLLSPARSMLSSFICSKCYQPLFQGLGIRAEDKRQYSCPHRAYIQPSTQAHQIMHSPLTYLSHCHTAVKDPVTSPYLYCTMCLLGNKTAFLLL